MTNTANVLYNRLVQKLTDRRLMKAARDLYNHDESWLCDFCGDCWAAEEHDATGPTFSCGGEPGYVDCPADGCPLDGGCVRNDLLFEDERVIACALEELESEEPDEDFAWEEYPGHEETAAYAC